MQGYGLGQSVYPVQVRINGDYRIEVLGEKGANDSLADHLSRPESLVLAHVTEVGSNQNNRLRPHFPGGRRAQHQFNQFLIGSIEGLADDQLFG